jgi:hypothetical protein
MEEEDGEEGRYISVSLCWAASFRFWPITYSVWRLNTTTDLFFWSFFFFNRGKQDESKLPKGKMEKQRHIL